MELEDGRGAQQHVRYPYKSHPPPSTFWVFFLVFTTNNLYTSLVLDILFVRRCVRSFLHSFFASSVDTDFYIRFSNHRNNITNRVKELLCVNLQSFSRESTASTALKSFPTTTADSPVLAEIVPLQIHTYIEFFYNTSLR
jgi:hypothetical protein